MARPSLLIDLQRCIGCMSCAVACKTQNDVPVGISLNTVHQVGPVGEWPYGLSQYWFPQSCMHCNNPLCVEVCPTGASYKREDGLVLVDHEMCIQCGSCENACPYGHRVMDPVKSSAVKCTLCQPLIDAGKEPSCVKHCMAVARFYGDLDDPENKINKYLAEPGNADRAIKLKESDGSEPTVVYLMPKCGMLDDVTEVPLM